MDTNVLLPGYTIQGFSVFRGKLHEAADWTRKKNEACGVILSFPVTLVHYGSEYAEVPIRIIEDVALLIINASGACFSQGCRNNLYAFGGCIVSDTWDLAISTLAIVCFMELAIAWNVSCAALNAFEDQFSYNQSQEEMAAFYRIKATRVHGYSEVFLVEWEIKDALQNMSAEQKRKFYEEICQMSTEGLREIPGLWNKNKSSNRNAFGGSPEGWVCPEELKGLNTNQAEKVKRILKLSHEVKPESLPASKRREYFCSLLGLDSQKAGEEDIKQAWRLARLSIHPDKNSTPCAGEAFSAINKAHEAYAPS